MKPDLDSKEASVLRKYVILTFVLTWAAVSLGVIAGLGFYLYRLGGDRVFPGLTVGGYYVGGTSTEVLTEEVARLADQWGRRQIEILYPGRGQTTGVWKLPVSELGFCVDVEETVARALAVGRQGSFFDRIRTLALVRRKGYDIDLVVTQSEPAVDGFLQKLKEKVEFSPEPARYDYTRRQIVGGEDGQFLLADKTWGRIADAVRSNVGRVEVAVKKEPSTVSHWNLVPASFAVELSRVSTPLGGSDAARVNNIRLAAGKLNGLILLPGDSFSFNEVIGPRTVERGYQPAPEIVNQELVEGVGGGICQVSTTLYNAALLGGMKIQYRRNHSMPLGYVPLGQDATVYYDTIDLRFRNDLDFPVAIVSGIKDWHVWIALLGKEKPYERVYLEARDVELIPRPVRYLEAGGKELTELPTGAVVAKTVQEGRDGYRVKTYRISQNGMAKHEELISRDYYPPSPKVCLIEYKGGEYETGEGD